MEIRKATIQDLPVVVKMKMDMFKEVGSINLLRDNAEELILKKYMELYNDDGAVVEISADLNVIAGLDPAIPG